MNQYLLRLPLSIEQTFVTLFSFKSFLFLKIRERVILNNDTTIRQLIEEEFEYDLLRSNHKTKNKKKPINSMRDSEYY